jgi:hypothetical protein
MSEDEHACKVVEAVRDLAEVVEGCSVVLERCNDVYKDFFR